MRKWYPPALIALLLIVSAIVYPRMPEQVAIHFTADGTPNGWGPRWEALLAMPVIMLFTWGMMVGVPKVDPRRENYARMQGAYTVTYLAVLTFLALGHIAIIGYALGWPVSIGRVVPALVGVLLIAIGNVLPQARPNWFFGIRTPWTLTNDRVWERTHRIGGYLLVGAGVISIIAVMLPQGAALPIQLGAVGAAVVGSFAYSYLAWKQETSR
jgi:uncharacterized membrane protein